MTPSENVDRYLEEAAIQELVHKYEGQGYSLLEDGLPEINVKPDLVLERNGKKLLIEVVIRGEKESIQADKILKIHKALQDVQPAEFKTVFVNAPRRAQAAIEGIEEILLNELLSGDYYIEIGNGPTYNNVDDVEIDDLKITHEGVFVTGSCAVDVSLSFGPSRDGIDIDESFPATFKAHLDHDLNSIDVEISIDTSSWDEAWTE